MKAQMSRIPNPLLLFLAVVIIAVASLAACAQLGVAPADTFDKKAVAGYAGVKAASDSVATLYQGGRLSGDEARSASMALHQVVAGLDTAVSLSKTNPQAAGDRLTLAITALSTLQAFLLQRQGAKP